MRFLLLLILMAVGCGIAPSQDDDTAVMQAVRDRDDAERIAALNRDTVALADLWSDDFVVNAPNNQTVIGKDANLQAFVRSGIIDFTTFDRAIEHVAVSGELVAIMGAETVVPRSDAPSVGLVAGQPVHRRFTNIWRREGDTWRLYWRHANVIPSP